MKTYSFTVESAAGKHRIYKCPILRMGPKFAFVDETVLGAKGTVKREVEEIFFTAKEAIDAFRSAQEDLIAEAKEAISEANDLEGALLVDALDVIQDASGGEVMSCPCFEFGFGEVESV